MLRLAATVPITAAEGPGLRFAVWVQGCSVRCAGCCNPEMFEPAGGRTRGVAALLREIEAARDEHAIEGITVLGGEPTDQLAAVTRLCEGAQARGLGVIVFTGRTREELEHRPGFEALWRSVDTLVDGRYEARRPEPATGRAFVGSANQRLLHRTPRYADEALWRGGPRLELHVGPDGSVHVHGAPGLARDLLRRLDQG